MRAHEDKISAKCAYGRTAPFHLSDQAVGDGIQKPPAITRQFALASDTRHYRLCPQVWEWTSDWYRRKREAMRQRRTAFRKILAAARRLRVAIPASRTSQFPQVRATVVDRAILCAVIGSISVSVLVIVAFTGAFFEIRHERGVAILFIISIGAFVVSLIDFSRQVRFALSEFDHYA